jgi:ribosomal protein L37AE/L43A
MSSPYDDLRALYPWLARPACGPGWHALAEEMCERIATALPRSALRGFAVVEVSERAGRLRVRVVGAGRSEALLVAAIAREAEEASETVCQQCGRPGARAARGGWTATLCDEHRAQGTWV